MFTLVLLSILLIYFYYTSNSSEESHMLLAFECDDSDIKIAPDRFGSPKIYDDNSSKDGDIYFLHKQNGNIGKAHQIGRELAILVAEHSGTRNIENYEFVNFQIKALVAFIAERCIEEYSPDSIIAKSSKTIFYEQIKKYAPQVYDFIINSGSYSIYMLCLNDSKDYSYCVGSSFAKSCQKPDDSHFIEIGKEVYSQLTRLCEYKYSHINFANI